MKREKEGNPINQLINNQKSFFPLENKFLLLSDNIVTKYRLIINVLCIFYFKFSYDSAQLEHSLHVPLNPL